MDGFGRLYHLLRPPQQGNCARIRLGTYRVSADGSAAQLEVAGTTQELDRCRFPERLLAPGVLVDGDTLLMLSDDDQTFFVLDKVVGTW